MGNAEGTTVGVAGCVAAAVGVGALEAEVLALLAARVGVARTLCVGVPLSRGEEDADGEGVSAAEEDTDAVIETEA